MPEMNAYDTEHLTSILGGEGTWYNARLLRALDSLLPYADENNSRVLMRAFPQQCIALLRSYGWPEHEIVERMSR